jgi:hypothetical protein
MQFLSHGSSVMSYDFSFDAGFLRGLMYDLFATFSLRGMAMVANGVQQ